METWQWLQTVGALGGSALLLVVLVACTLHLALAGIWLELLPVPLVVIALGAYTKRRYARLRRRRLLLH